MPPYAGLDEAWHVARVAFVRKEHRNPTIVERSIPPYLAASIGGRPGAMPAFGEMRQRWPDVVASGSVLVDRPFSAADLAPDQAPNYEAQQPAPYYTLAALAPVTGAQDELRALRLVAVFCGVVIALATFLIARRIAPNHAAFAAAMVVSTPTWITLVVRASNDAPACAAIAAAVAVTLSAPTALRAMIGEAIAWTLAVALKLYAWPIAILFPVLWRFQRGSFKRLAIVSFSALGAAAFTFCYLATHTRNPVGVFGFDAAKRASRVHPVPIDFLTMMKTTVASAIWASGQHNDAMTTPAMALYALPLLAALISGTWLLLRDHRALGLSLLWVVGAFAIAQMIVACAFIRQARASGLALPLGGKEGWYWLATAPLIFGLVVPKLASRLWMFGLWLVVWDILITEGALFHDFAGTSSPGHPSLLFRWGPWHVPFTANLHGVGVGPLASKTTLLRLVQLGALAALIAVESSQRKVQHE